MVTCFVSPAEASALSPAIGHPEIEVNADVADLRFRHLLECELGGLLLARREHIGCIAAHSRAARSPQPGGFPPPESIP
jgi:hypothetical protein